VIGFFDASDFPESAGFSASRFAVIEPGHVLDIESLQHDTHDYCSFVV
jgi:hypothetical protein